MAIEPTVNYINRSSAYGRYIPMFGSVKRQFKGKQSAYAKAVGGYSPAIHDVTSENKFANEIIHESLNKILKKSLKPHMSKYMKSNDGKALQNEVMKLIRMKIRSGKKKI